MPSNLENPPGYVFEEDFWEKLAKGDQEPAGAPFGVPPGARTNKMEEVSFSKGDEIAASRVEEIYFIRSGVVAVDVPQPGGTARRLLLTRGMHFSPSSGAGAPMFSALTAARTKRLRKSHLSGDDQKEVEDVLGRLNELEPRLLDAVKAFFAQSDLGYLSTKVVLDLVKLEGVPVVLEAASTPKFLADGLVYVAEGEARVVEGKEVKSTAVNRQLASGSSRNCRRLLEGAVYSGQFNIERQAHDRCVLIHLPAAGIERFRRSSPSLRRGLRALGQDCLPRVSPGDDDGYPPQFVLLGKAGIDVPLSALTRLLAETVAEDFGSKTLVLTVKAGQELPASPSAVPGARAWSSSVGIESLRYDAPALQEYDCVFLDVLGVSGEMNAQMGRLLANGWDPSIQGASMAAEPTSRGKRTRAPLTTVVFTRDPFADTPDELVPLLDNREQRVVLLGTGLGDEDPAFLPRTTRLRLNLEEVRRLEGPDLRRLPSAMRGAFSRLARAITDRQVGLALGGGGAWAFAHLALIEALHQARIPIDLVSGASGGALVGAYYCALGFEGLDRLRKAAGRMDLALVAAACSTRPLAWSIQLDLEGRRLRDLDVPLYPIVADLTNGVEFVPRRGGLGVAECVRAASTLVPIAAPTDFEGRRCADGVFVNNTGERILAEEGADLLIASDVVQTPAEAPRGGFWDLVYRIRRIRDVVDAAHLLVQSSDARDSFLADCSFRVANLATGPVGFAFGRANERAARQQAENFVREQVQPHWDRLRGP